MPTQLQKDYKSALEAIDDIKKNAPAGDISQFTETDRAEYIKRLDRADKLMADITLEDKEAKIRELAGKSAGSFVASSFLGETPSTDGLAGISQTEKGELFALDGAYKGIAEAKLNTLKSGEFKDAFAMYLRRGEKNYIRGDNNGQAMKILNEGSDPTGGFWVPPAWNPELVKKMAYMATVRPNAKVYNTGSDHLKFPAVNYNGSTADDTYAQIFTSGMRSGWRNAAPSTSDFTEATNPVAGEINIPVQLETAAIILTREQTEDNGFDILGYINDLGAEAFTMGEEYAYTLGSGAGLPQGFTQHPSMAIAYSTYATTAGSTYWGNKVLTGSTTFTWGTATTGAIGVEAQLPPQYEYNAKWLASKATYAGMRALNVGTATLPQWGFGNNWPNYVEGLAQQPLLGYPILKNQFVTSLTNAVTFLYLGDLSGYYIVDRAGFSVEVFREVYGLRDQVVVYMRKRTGGQLVQYWKMKALAST